LIWRIDGRKSGGDAHTGRKTVKYFAALAAAGALLASSSSSQDVDTQALQTLHWRLIGSFRGGRVSAVAGVPGDPNIYYFGTPGGGIWKTTDAGRVWEPIFDKERVASIGALAVAISDSNIIYAGTGEQTPGNGVYKSTDAGKTWSHAGLEQTRFIQAVIVDPHYPDILIAADQRPSAPQLQAVEEQCSALTNVLVHWKQLNDGLAKQNPLNLPVDTKVSSTGCTQ
jgi:hypothetical protein